MTDPKLRELLDSAAPAQPDLTPAARTSAVTTRARAVRRRNGFVLAAAVAAVVGVGVAVPLVGSGGDDGGTPVASDPPPPVEVVPPDCPAEAVDVTEGTTVDALPDGAVSVRACAADFDQQGAPAGTGRSVLDLPAEPVVEGADELLAAVRELPAYTLEEECAFTMMMAQPWALVVSYPDGTSATLGSTTRTCASVPVEGVDRSAEAILGLFTSAVGTP